MPEENVLVYDMSDSHVQRIKRALRAYDVLIGDNGRQEVVNMQAAIERFESEDEDYLLHVTENDAQFVADMLYELSCLQVEGFEFRNQRIERLARTLENQGIDNEVWQANVEEASS